MSIMQTPHHFSQYQLSLTSIRLRRSGILCHGVTGVFPARYSSAKDFYIVITLCHKFYRLTGGAALIWSGTVKDNFLILWQRRKSCSEISKSDCALQMICIKLSFIIIGAYKQCPTGGYFFSGCLWWNAYWFRHLDLLLFFYLNLKVLRRAFENKLTGNISSKGYEGNRADDFILSG